MAVKGAVLGDIAGSQYEFKGNRKIDWKHCSLFTEHCSFTDDTVMTLAIKKAVDEGRDYGEVMRETGKHYPDCGWGKTFFRWIYDDKMGPYGSYGNGSAMRVSYVGEHFDTLEEVKAEARKTALVSHDHEEGIKGAVVTAVCVFMAKKGCTKEEIYSYVSEEYPEEDYPFSMTRDMEDLRKNYTWDVSCMGSVPVAMRCFYESRDYESFIRNVFSLDADTDTLCAIGGGVAEEFYHGTGLDENRILKEYLDERLLKILEK